MMLTGSYRYCDGNQSIAVQSCSDARRLTKEDPSGRVERRSYGSQVEGPVLGRYGENKKVFDGKANGEL